MKTVLAEKPSIARELAYLLGVSEKKDGYLTGSGYFVTWTSGHLVELNVPEDYEINGNPKSQLPILSQPFLLTVRKVKKDEGFVTDAIALKQLEIINQLFKQSERIIVATDASPEGELVFRHIYEYLKCSKPYERLWISSLTEKAIRKGLDNLIPGKQFDKLFQAAEARIRIDMLLKINTNQALNISTGNETNSMGRLEIPTLALICSRYLENTSFTAHKYWQIELTHSKDFIEFKSLSKIKWNNREHALSALRTIERIGSVKVASAKIRSISQSPPLLFDLTGLQKEANKKLGLSAQETLSTAQTLFEKKFITYPLTESKYIPESMWQEIPALVRALQDKNSCKQAAAKVKWRHFSKRIIKDLRVTDHHGLLTTEIIPSALTFKENAVYDLIAFRLLQSISQSCVKEVSEANFEVLHYEFVANGCSIVEGGWRSINGIFNDEDNEPLQRLPLLSPGDQLKTKKIVLLEKQNKAPELYTETELLAAMEFANTNEEEPKVNQGFRLGKPAKMAEVIETLLALNYIRRERKALLPTEKGLQVYELIKDKKIANPAITSHWELILQRMENGEVDLTEFQSEIEIYASMITNELLQNPIAKNHLPQLECPKCRSEFLIICDHQVKCPDELCNWVQFRNVCGVLVGIEDIKSLLTLGRTSLIKGMKSKSGKRFNAYLVLNEDCKTSFEFESKKV